MPPPGMLPPVLFPGLIRPGIQQQPLPAAGPGILPEASSQGDAGDKDKPQAGSDKRQESSEDSEAAKGRCNNNKPWQIKCSVNGLIPKVHFTTTVFAFLTRVKSASSTTTCTKSSDCLLTPNKEKLSIKD